mgnify:CR=1 FL=1
MTSFYEITPLDTLFFRGATPMETGQYNAQSVFPPPATVLKGALWTAYCLKSGKDFSDGLVNGKIPAEITSFFIKKNDKCYAPAPATWYYDCADKKKKGAELNGVPLCVAKNMSGSFAKLNMKGSAGNVVFAVPKMDAKPLGGAWILVDFLQKPKAEFASDTVLFTSDIYSSESRTGVGLTPDKKAEDGKLYTSTHIRLHDGVTFVLAVESDIDFGEGKMLLGGERRIAKYTKCELPTFAENNSALYLSLMPIEANADNLSTLVASAKLAVTSGWDMAKGFHKPSVSWIPAGAVFNLKVNDSCIPLGIL